MNTEKLYPFNKEKQDQIYDNTEKSLKRRKKKVETEKMTKESSLLQNWLDKPEKVAELKEDDEKGDEEGDQDMKVYDTKIEKSSAAKKMNKILEEKKRIDAQREEYEQRNS